MKTTLLSVFFSFLLLNSYSQGFQQTAGMAAAGPCEAIFVDGDLILTSVANKLFRSTDGGATFDYVSMGQWEVTPRTFSKVGDVIIMGAINGERIYRSLDNGASWEIANEGGPTISGFPSAVPITSTVLNGEVFMCGTNFIRKTSNEGLTWETMAIDGLCYDISETNGNIWATPGGNLHKSTDGGATWDDVPDNGLFFSNSSVDVLESDGRIFVCTSLSAGNGLYHSDDGGENYVLNAGDFSIGNKIESYSGKLYLTHFGGLSVSEDNGDTWTNVAGLANFIGYSGDMAFDGDETIWLSSELGLFSYNINSGETGSVVLPVGNVGEVSIGANALYGLQNGMVFQSFDNGDTWNNINGIISGSEFTAYDVYADGNEVYVSGIQDFVGAFFTSMDGGATFSQVTIPAEVAEVIQILSYNPVVMATDAGAYISMDNGETFTLADLKATDGSDLPDAESFNDISQNGNSIFLAGPNGGAYSHDNGSNWTFVPMTGLTKLSGWEGRLVRHVTNAWPLFLTQESTDGGLTWTDLTGYTQQFSGPEFMWMAENTLYVQNDQQSALPGEFNKLSETDPEWVLEPSLGSLSDQVISVSSNGNGGWFLGTKNSGAWISDGLTNTFFQREEAKFALYPNPTTGLVNIQYDASMDLKDYQIRIYDTSGRLVKTQDPNRNTIDLSAVESGYYLVTLQSAQHIQSVWLTKR